MHLETSRKLDEANAQLNSLKERANVYRKLVKANYPQDQWERFGLMDKR